MLLKEVMEFLLSDVLVNILDMKICLIVEGTLWVGLGLDDDECASLKDLIVHFLLASVSFSLVDELQVAVASRFVGLGIYYDLCTLDLVSTVGEVLVEVEIKEILLRKVGNIEGRNLVHLLLALLLRDVSSWPLAHVQMIELIQEHLVLLLLEQLLLVRHLIHHTHGRANLLLSWASSHHGRKGLLHHLLRVHHHRRHLRISKGNLLLLLGLHL